MNFNDLTLDIVKECLINKMYSFNKFGEVKEFYGDKISKYGVHRKMGNHNHTYTWEKFGIYWFFDEEECKKKANEYLQSLGMPISKFKRIYNYFTKHNIYDDKPIYCKNEDGKIHEGELGDYNEYDKSSQKFLISSAYDDDWGGGYETEEFPISEYGKTWAIYKKDLEGDKKDG